MAFTNEQLERYSRHIILRQHRAKTALRALCGVALILR